MKVRERIKQFEMLKLFKEDQELTESNEETLSLLRSQRETEINEYIEGSTNQKKEIEKQSEEMINEMVEKHQKEFEELEQNFEENFNKLSPPKTKQILELEAKLTFAVKKNNYKQAQEYRTQLEELIQINEEKWNGEEKDKKRNAEVRRLKKKQEQELNALKQKIEAVLNELELSHKKELEIIQKKYNNKEKMSMIEHKRLKNQMNMTSQRTLNRND